MVRRSKDLFHNDVLVGTYLGSDDPEEDQAAAVEALRAKGLLNPPSIARAMLNQADSFAFVANELYKRLNVKGLIDRPLLIAPFVVNAAFSIELYLKTLQELAGGAKRGHKLVELFNALQQTQQDELQAQTIQLAAKQKHAPEIQLRNILLMLNDSFERWRYVYETPRTGLVNMRQAMLAMEATRTVCFKSMNALTE